MRLRSLHLDSGRSWRGGQRQVLLLIEGLRARGDEPLIVGTLGAPLVERAHALGLATAAVSMRNDWDLRSSNRIRALIRTWRPHIVHAHDARSHAIALLALRGSRKEARVTPLVVTRRVTFPPKSLRLKYGSRVTQFIAISGAVKRVMVDAGIDERRIEIVHSGVPTPTVITPRDWRAELRWPVDSIVVGIVGAMTAEKGIALVDQIISLLPPLAAQRTKIVFLGGQPRGHERLGPVDVFHAGFISEIYDAMAGLDLIWHPALEEGLGTALIDALALKLPPIAFNVGGIPELIEHQRSGLLVSPGDLSAFAEAHIALLEDEIRNRLAEAGPPRARLFNVAEMTEKTVKVYNKVLEPVPRWYEA